MRISDWSSDVCSSDLRFQAGLLAAAKKVGKIESEWRIPAHSLRNTPDALAASLQPYRAPGVLPLFPLGSDFVALEQALFPALGRVQQAAATTTQLQLFEKLLLFNETVIPPRSHPSHKRANPDPPK